MQVEKDNKDEVIKSLEEIIKRKNQEIEALNNRVQAYIEDPIEGGYNALVKILNEQQRFLHEFDFKSEISITSKEDKRYERASSLWVKLPDFILTIQELGAKIKMFKEVGQVQNIEDPKVKKIPTTPESIADVLGNIAGQQS